MLIESRKPAPKEIDRDLKCYHHYEMGISAIERQTTKGSYNICNYNDQTKAILTILTLTDEKNFEKNRNTIIKKIVGIPHPKDPRQSIDSLFKDALFSRSSWGKGSMDEEKIAITTSLTDQLLGGKISAYEATGRMKEINPTLTSKDMTDLWTKLSIIVGLESLKSNALEKNWEQEIRQASLEPRLRNLKASLYEGSEKRGVINKTYRENYPHLKSSTGNNINWAEIVSNLSPQAAGMVKCMLNSSKTSILKKEAMEQTLFPRPQTNEIENRRLANLLTTVGNAHNNRTKRYQRVVFNLEESRKVNGLPSITLPSVTANEEKKTKKSINWIQKRLEEHKVEQNPEKLPDIVSGSELFITKKYILGLRKINSEIAQDAWNKWKTIVDRSQELSSDNKIINHLKRGLGITQEVVLKRLKKLCTKETINEQIIEEYLKKLETTPENLKELDTPIMRKSNGVNTFLDRHLKEIPSKKDWGRGIFLLETLTGNSPYPLNEPLGPKKATPLQIATLLGQEEEVAAIVEKLRDHPKSLNPCDPNGRTPLFTSKPAITTLLLKHGADYDKKDNNGHKAETENPYPESRKIIKEFKTKRKIQELIKAENEGFEVV